jgi:hypothetical protein
MHILSKGKRIALIIYAIIIGISDIGFSQARPFVPQDFKVPDTLDNQHFRLRMLTVNDVVKDYDAVMTSIDQLQKIYPYSDWPTSELTFEQDLIDLGWHQKEFQTRRSFAYTVVSLDEKQILGCLYINPTTKGDYDASITMWVRTSMLDKGLDKILFDSVQKWIVKDWPFRKVAYPGRGITWDAWQLLK